MKKIVSLALTAAMALALLAGCAAPTAAPAAPAATEAPAVTEAPAPAAAEPAPAEEPAEEPWEPVTLKVGFMGKGIKPVGVIVAMAKGFYEEEGIIIDAQKVSSMNDAYLAVSKGDLDIYLFSSTAAATFISQGTTTLRVFGGTASEGSEIMCDVNSDLKLDTLADFLGKTVACMMPETGQMVSRAPCWTPATPSAARTTRRT
ncbi:MAG: ABC transporter substrate-binding protein [Oscillospiraceae bacterium]|nr:ABC transporter substrate-binding protein [Oscillospiraceae bacterium]